MELTTLIVSVATLLGALTVLILAVVSRAEQRHKIISKVVLETANKWRDELRNANIEFLKSYILGDNNGKLVAKARIQSYILSSNKCTGENDKDCKCRGYPQLLCCLDMCIQSVYDKINYEKLVDAMEFVIHRAWETSKANAGYKSKTSKDDMVYKSVNTEKSGGWANSAVSMADNQRGIIPFSQRYYECPVVAANEKNSALERSKTSCHCDIEDTGKLA